ncbi:MAG: hypothetical protein LBM70_05725 [Victivallales bacterium]|jgi:hypothetical protein|nr:hypothetical protein [Victivallales bacterium]
MAFYSCSRVTFFCLAGIFFLFVLFFDVWQKKWKRFVLDFFIGFMQMPLWIILGIAILGIFPALIYSYFSGIWLLVGVLLWIAPHTTMTIKAIWRKDWFDMACSIAGILAIISLCIFIYFWDLAKMFSE